MVIKKVGLFSPGQSPIEQSQKELRYRSIQPLDDWAADGEASAAERFPRGPVDKPS
jgi:hypothetical protein